MCHLFEVSDGGGKRDKLIKAHSGDAGYSHFNFNLEMGTIQFQYFLPFCRVTDTSSSGADLSHFDGVRFQRTCIFVVYLSLYNSILSFEVREE